MRQPRGASIILVTVCLILYGRSIDFDFVRADDTDLIEGNAEFLSSITNIPAAFTRSFFESASVLTDLKTYYRPLAVVSFIVDTAITGVRPAIYHFTNVVLHALVAVLLFAILRTGTSTERPGTPGTRHPHRHRGTGTAFFAALLFAVHPANVQTVCWVMGRNELLLAVFSLIAFWSFIRDKFAIHALAFAGAIFSKETGVVLLPLFGLWTLVGGPLIRSGVSTLSLSDERPDKVRPTTANSSLASWKLLGLDAAVVAIWWALRRIALAGAAGANGVSWRSVAMNVPQVFSYMEKVLFPFRLNPMPGVDRWSAVLGTIAAASIAAPLIRSLDRRRAAFVAAWFGLFLAPALLVPGLPAYEHRLYLPMIGLALGFGFWASERPEARASGTEQKAYSLATILVAAAFAVIAFRHSETFRSPLVYWTRATESTTRFAPIAHVNVGQLLQDAGQPQEASAHFRRALAIDPNTPKANNNLGVALMRLNQPRAALEAFRREVAQHPTNADAQFNVGLYLKLSGQPEQAVSYWEAAIRVNKYYVPAYEELSSYYSSRGDHAAAESYAQRLRSLQAERR